MIAEPPKPLILIVDDTPTNIQVLAEGLKPTIGQGGHQRQIRS